nr:unnamed protein product [Spirometra erinaceieuropaei]
MFADDIKLWSVIRTADDEEHLQANLNRLQQWSKAWLLPFNEKKCNILRVGRARSPNHMAYCLNGIPLQEVGSQKDSGVWITTSFKPSLHCTKIAKSAMSVLYLVKRAFSAFDEDCFAKVFRTFVRPQLEFAIQAWRPWTAKDLSILDRVQRRATKLVAGQGSLPYATRLANLDLFPLSYRQLQGDLIQAFRIIRGQDCSLVPGDFFELATTTNLPGHPFKLRVTGARLDTRKFFFSNRVLEAWNALPADVVMSASVEIGVNPALDSILLNYKYLFRDDSATHYRGPPVKFQFQSDFRPRFFKARTVPYAVAPKVEEELDRLQKADVIEPVQYSEWAAPIVPVLKSDGSVHICGDYKLIINSATKLNPYTPPRIEDLLVFSDMLLDAYRDECPETSIAHRTYGQLLNSRRRRVYQRPLSTICSSRTIARSASRQKYTCNGVCAPPHLRLRKPRTVNTGKVVVMQVSWALNPNTPPPPTCPCRQRTSRARTGLVRHLQTQCNNSPTTPPPPVSPPAPATKSATPTNMTATSDHTVDTKTPNLTELTPITTSIITATIHRVNDNHHSDS